MNWNSYICRYISTHQKTWEEDMKNAHVNIKKEGDLAIFNYDDFGADFHDPIIAEARGIIIDISRLEVVCWPFRKFGNWQESYADSIDWKSAMITRKMDGSIVKLWRDKTRVSPYGGWRFSTNSEITPFFLYEELITKAISKILIGQPDFFDRLNSEETYIFELVSPRNKVVVSYPETKLWHIGTRNNRTGQEKNVFLSENYIGVSTPDVIYLGAEQNLEECIASAKKLNVANTTSVNFEGYVVVDKDFHRIKVKSPEYIMAHKAISIGISKRDAVNTIRNPKEMKEMIQNYPTLEKVLNYYSWQYSELVEQVDRFCSYVRGLYEELDRDRLAVAKEIKDHPLAIFGFHAIGKSDVTAKELVDHTPDFAIAKLLDEYRRHEFSFSKEYEHKLEIERQEALEKEEKERESFGSLNDGSIWNM